MPTLPLPLLESLLSSVQCVEIIETTDPIRIEDGIFSQSWQARLKISAESVSKDATQVAQAQVVFPATEDFSSFRKSIPVLVRHRVGMDFPDVISFGVCTEYQQHQYWCETCQCFHTS